MEGGKVFPAHKRSADLPGIHNLTSINMYELMAG